MGNQTIYKKTIDIAIKQLHEIQHPSAETMLKNTAKKFLGRSVADKDIMFWPAGMLLLGLVRGLESKYIDDSTRKRIIKEINNHLDIWDEKVEFVDDCLAGVAIIKYMQYIEHNYPNESTMVVTLTNYINKIYSFIKYARTDSTGSIVYNSKANNDYIFADGCGMTTMFLSAYAAVFDDSEARLLAEKQFYDYMNNGLDKRTGLPYHGYSLDEHEQKGIIGWGRAVGWIMMGLSEYVQLEDANKIFTKWYQQLLITALTYQREDGGYSWQLECTGGHIDTSATGMITYGLMPAIDNENIDIGLINATCTDGLSTSINKAVQCLLEHIDNNGNVTDSLSPCKDFAVHYQTYGCYPWGQGATVAVLSLF